MAVLRVRLFKGGHCTHKEQMVIRNGRRATVAFPSMFALIEHPTQGAMLFDTGYGQPFFEATRYFPGRFYRMLTPVQLAPHETAVAQLQQIGYAPEDIRHILISHFHGDHVAALRDFGQARMVFLESGYRHVKPLQGIRAVRLGYLPSVLPDDFESRAVPVSDSSGHLQRELPPFGRVYDLFGDGLIQLVPLEGHFCGQMGAWLQTDAGPLFLIADACWYRASFERLVLPHPLAMLLMHNPDQYRQDLARIHLFAHQHPEALIVPSHCPPSIHAYARQAAASA